MKHRIRYCRDKNNKPIKTLATTQVDGVVYFGISRCNPKDSVSKKMGVELALRRMNIALTLPWCHNPPDGTMPMTGDSLIGSVPVGEVKTLLQWFESKHNYHPKKGCSKCCGVVENDSVIVEQLIS